MEEDEPSFLEPIDYSAESNDEDGELENEPGSEAHENPDHHDPLFDPETSHRARRWGLLRPLNLAAFRLLAYLNVQISQVE